jgi:hypothetical protein
LKFQAIILTDLKEDVNTGNKVKSQVNDHTLMKKGGGALETLPVPLIPLNIILAATKYLTAKAVGDRSRKAKGREEKK